MITSSRNKITKGSLREVQARPLDDTLNKLVDERRSMERWILSLVIPMILFPAGAFAQAPDWHWGRVINNDPSGPHMVVATNEGGCYLGSGTDVIRYNDFGDHLWTISFSEEIRLFRTADHQHAGFIMQYEENAVAAGNSFTAAPGASFVIGFFNPDGSLYDIQNFPALLGVPVMVADMHRGPNGDLLLIGHFSDSLHVSDTTITGYQHSGFLARFSDDGNLQWARSLMNTEGGGFGGNSACVKQSGTGDVYINLGAPYPASISDTLFEPGGSAFARFTVDGDLLWSYTTDGGSLAGDEVLFDLRSNGGLFYSRSTLGMSSLISFFGSLNAEGELEWESEFVEDMTVQNVYTGPVGNALFSGSRYGLTMDIGGCMLPSGTPRMFMIDLESDGTCNWIKQSPGPAYGFLGYAVEQPTGVLYTIGSTDWSSIILGSDTLTFTAGPVHYYVARLGQLPMEVGSVPELQNDLLLVHPNPVTDAFFLTVPQAVIGTSVSLHDPLGRVVGSHQLNSTLQRVDVTGLPSGLYLVKYGTHATRVVIE